jgi:hypothetical protein
LQSISWTVGSSGAFTEIQRNHDEGTPRTVDYKTRRQAELAAKRREEAAREAVPSRRARNIKRAEVV